MTPLGFKRKELYGHEHPCSPDSEKDWENEEVFPRVNAEGKLAEAMGAADLKAGDVFEVRVQMRVDEHKKISKDNTTKYEMCLSILAMDDIEDVESSDAEVEEEVEVETEVIGDSPVAVVLGARNG